MQRKKEEMYPMLGQWGVPLLSPNTYGWLMYLDVTGYKVHDTSLEMRSKRAKKRVYALADLKAGRQGIQIQQPDRWCNQEQLFVITVLKSKVKLGLKTRLLIYDNYLLLRNAEEHLETAEKRTGNTDSFANPS